MRKETRAFIVFLEDHGYVWDRTNTKSVEYYRNAAGDEVPVTQSMSEQSVKRAKARVQRLCGEATAGDAVKRDAAAVRERREAERERAAAEVSRREAEVARLVAEREAAFGGLGRQLTEDEISSIEGRIKEEERELREWQRLMTEIPTSGAHSGRVRAQHRA